MATKRKRTYRRRSSSISVKKILAGAGAGALAPGLLGLGLGYYIGGLSGVLGAIGAPMVEEFLSGGGGLLKTGIKVYS